MILEQLPAPRRTPIQRYLSYRRSNSARTTVMRARSTLVYWVCFLVQRGVEIETAGTPDAYDFVASWPWAASTKTQAITDLRTFYEWLVDEDVVIKNPFRRVRGPSKPRRIPIVLAPEEVAALDGVLRRPTVRDLRDRALLQVLRACGGRIGEVRSLNMSRLYLKERYAVVHGKGDKDRIVYFDDEAVTALRSWIEVGRPLWAKASEPIFVGRHGRRLCYTACRDSLIRAERLANLPRHVYPHLFRHTFATEMLEKGANLREVQELLGHENISTTQIYTHVSPKRLREVYDRVMCIPSTTPHCDPA